MQETKPQLINSLPEIPGNYTKDLLEYLEAKGTDAFPKPLEDTRGIVLALDIRNFTFMMEEIDEPKMNDFLTEFFDNASRVIQEYPSGYVNKFLGDGLLAHFTDYNPHDIIKLAFDILGEFSLARKKSTFPFIGLTQVIALHNFYIGSVGKLNYFDYTLIGKSINRAFRVLNEGEGDCIYVTDKLFNKINDKYIALNSGINLYKGVTTPIISYAVFREKKEEEIKSGNLKECPQNCPFFQFCYTAWERGRKGIKFIDCHSCRIVNEKDEVIRETLCDYWSTCKKKHKRGENKEIQTCCQSCRNFRNCYRNNLAGLDQKKMISCLLFE